MKFVSYQISLSKTKKLVYSQDMVWLDFHDGIACLASHEILKVLLICLGRFEKLLEDHLHPQTLNNIYSPMLCN